MKEFICAAIWLVLFGIAGEMEYQDELRREAYQQELGAQASSRP